MMRTSTLVGAAIALAFVASPSRAADLGDPAPVPAEPAYEQRVFSWSGPYIGAHIGYAWGLFDTNSAVGDIDGEGTVGGVLAGFNTQFNRFVVGIEGDWSATDFRGNTFAAAGTLRGTADWFATLRARAGVALDRYLVYGTGGVAFTDVNLAGFGGSANDTLTGWTIGAGVEGALTDNVIARLEYSYMDFPAQTYVLGGTPVRSDLDTHTVRAAVSYKFNMF